MPESPLAGLEPRILWNAFDALRRVPRPSKKEERAVAFVRDWAAEHGFDVRADAASNLVVSVPATAGREDAPTVVLQAHLDMVCEKNEGVEHDFDNDPIAVEVDGERVRARGTTLGADNGIGVAAALAAAIDPEAVHGPLELLMTVDEETGLNGAGALDPSIVSGRILLNLDSEEEGALYIGCAGSSGNRGRLGVERDGKTPTHELVLKGLRGGHSGIDINAGRANAVKLLAGVLLDLAERGHDLHLAALDGGSARNAIPREAVASLALDTLAPGDVSASAVESALDEMATALRRRYPGEEKLELLLRPATASNGARTGGALTRDSRDRLLRLLDALPHGVLAMSQEVDGLVETSNNVAMARTDNGHVLVECTCRSSNFAAQRTMNRSIASAFRLAGAAVDEDRGYPGWAPNPDSPLVRRAGDAYEALFGRRPALKAIHAGLECGILVEKLPGLDAVSFGPDLFHPHSPDECVDVPSVGRFYQLLRRLLADLTQPV